MFFRAANPPYGTMITYYLRQSGSPVTLTVTDAAGRVVRTLSGPGAAGMHQVQWDLETDAAKAAEKQLAQGGGRGGGDRSAVTFSERQRRRRVPPGTYSVTASLAGATLTRSIVVKPETDDEVPAVATRK
jgi:hypothetical protein